MFAFTWWCPLPADMKSGLPALAVASQNHYGWKRPVRSSTINQPLPIPLNHHPLDGALSGDAQPHQDGTNAVLSQLHPAENFTCSLSFNGENQPFQKPALRLSSFTYLLFY